MEERLFFVGLVMGAFAWLSRRWSESQALAMNVRELIPEGERKKALEMVRALSRGVASPPRPDGASGQGRQRYSGYPHGHAADG